MTGNYTLRLYHIVQLPYNAAAKVTLNIQSILSLAFINNIRQHTKRRRI